MGYAYQKYSDEDIIENTKYLIDNNKSIFAVERELGVPYSTLSWHIRNRLKRVDRDLYDVAVNLLHEHFYDGSRKNPWGRKWGKKSDRSETLVEQAFSLNATALRDTKHDKGEALAPCHSEQCND